MHIQKSVFCGIVDFSRAYENKYSLGEKIQCQLSYFHSCIMYHTLLLDRRNILLAVLNIGKDVISIQYILEFL
jgi:hypothetical protein